MPYVCSNAGPGQIQGILLSSIIFTFMVPA